MNLPRNLLAACTLCLTMAATSGARAGIFNIPSFDNGAYQLGFHEPSSTGIFAGTNVEDQIIHNFFAFDLGTLSGQAVISATLTVFAHRSSFYFSFHLSETYGLFDYAGNIDNLLAGGGLIAHADLGSGTPYGQTTVFGPSYEFFPMPELSISLSPAAVADINAVLGSPDSRFVIGGALLSHSGDTEFGEALFFGSNFLPAGRLTLITPLSDNPLPPVPLPGALPLFASIFGLAGLFGWFRSRPTRAAD